MGWGQVEWVWKKGLYTGESCGERLDRKQTTRPAPRLLLHFWHLYQLLASHQPEPRPQTIYLFLHYSHNPKTLHKETFWYVAQSKRIKDKWNCFVTWICSAPIYILPVLDVWALCVLCFDMVCSDIGKRERGGSVLKLAAEWKVTVLLPADRMLPPAHWEENKFPPRAASTWCYLRVPGATLKYLVLPQNFWGSLLWKDPLW